VGKIERKWSICSIFDSVSSVCDSFTLSDSRRRGATLLALLAIFALSYVLFLHPPLEFLDIGQTPAGLMTPRIEAKIFLLAIFAVTVFSASYQPITGRKKARAASAGAAALHVRAARFLWRQKSHGAKRGFGER
jgi:hypothetical protein